MGSVFRKPSKRSRTGYRYYVSVTYKGQRHKEVAGDTERAAKQKLRKLENRLEKIGDLTPRRVPFDFLCKEYETWGDVNLGVRTIAERKILIRAHLIPFFTMLISELDEAAVEAYKAARIADGVSPSTLNNELKALRCILTYGKEMNFFDPGTDLPRIRKVKVPKKTQRRLSPEQIGPVLEQVRRPRTRAMLQLLIFAGLRKSELANLEWTDVDFERKLLHVRSKEAWQVKTENAARTIPLTKQAIAALKAAQELRRGEEPLVFPGKDGKPLTDIRAGLNGACDRAGIPRVHIHGLRHTFGTLLAQLGADPKAIMDAMGHADLKTTMGYIATARSHLREQVEKLNDVPVPGMALGSARPKTVPISRKKKKGTPARKPESP